MTHRALVSLGAFAALPIALFATGCVGTYGPPGDVDVVHGALGEVEFVGVPEVREVRVGRDELRIDLRIQSPNQGAAMIAIEIPRERGGDAEGLHLNLAEAEILGCSGPEDEEWEFDCHPDQYFVDVYEGKDQLELDFEGTFTTEGCGDLPDDAPEGGQDFGGHVDVDLI